MNVIVIGGGAAGFFTAINIAEKHPSYRITILEKTTKLLQKVKVSGGGRCNVTNARSSPAELVHFYPRGQKKLYPLFKSFSSNDMIDWLSARGVQTKTEADLRMFPASNSSATIIGCFLSEAEKHQVAIKKGTSVKSLSSENGKWKVSTQDDEFLADKVIVATGSSPATYNMLESTGLKLSERVPSLFTFNIDDSRIKNLPGISFPEAAVKVAKSKLQEKGPLLITHWGMSGPAVLKLSAWGAYEFQQTSYQFEILVNFLGLHIDVAKAQITSYREKHPKRKVFNYPLFDVPSRFWQHLLSYCGIFEHDIYGELSKKQLNKLLEELTQGRYSVDGKSTFKDEFVTAGGVLLSEIDLTSFESKRFKNLYIAGEALDIDALTGGFNFQACWSAGWAISEHI